LWPDAPVTGPASLPRIVPYLLPGPPARACVLVFPGGGYGNHAPHECEPVARWLNGLGVSAAVVFYRIAPHRHPLPLRDAQRAVRLARAHAAEWQVDPRRVGVLGFSAGGHCAASAGTIFDPGNPDAGDPVERQSSRPDAMILCYPVLTFGEYRHTGCMHNLLGENPPGTLRHELSLENRVTAQTPPTFLWHTTGDAAVPVQNSLLFAEALAFHQAPFALHVFPGGRHGLGLAGSDPYFGTWTACCAQWLERIGFARK
jgi:acetyl esterase/lipase